jgi:flagellar hook-associated protein 3 FlgL
MERVTTFSTYNSVINNLMTAENRQSQAQDQISSGKVASDLQGYSTNAEALTASRTLMTRVQGYVSNAKTLQTRLDTQNLALTQVSDAGTQARQAIANAIANGDAEGLMAELGSYLGQASAALNVQQDGQYLFSGGRVNTPPVAAKSLQDLLTPPAGGVFQNGSLVPTAQLDEATSLQTGQLADAIGQPLFNALASIAAYDQSGNGPLNGPLSPTQVQFLTNAMANFDTANKGLTDAVANNGLAQNRVDQSISTQQDRQTTLQEILGSITDVDMAEASSRLSQSQVAVQASARIFSSLQNTSLLSYLPPG